MSSIMSFQPVDPLARLYLEVQPLPIAATSADSGAATSKFSLSVLCLHANFTVDGYSLARFSLPWFICVPSIRPWSWNHKNRCSNGFPAKAYRTLASLYSLYWGKVLALDQANYIKRLTSSGTGECRPYLASPLPFADQTPLQHLTLLPSS